MGGWEASARVESPAFGALGPWPVGDAVHRVVVARSPVRYGTMCAVPRAKSFVVMAISSARARARRREGKRGARCHVTPAS